MRLEDEIKTKGFKSERHKLTINLIYSYNWLINRNATLFKKFGITAQQYNILRILRGQGDNPSNIQLIKERMLDKQPDVSRLIDRLHQKEWIERTVSASDRRKLDLRITKAGLDLLARMDPEMETLETGLSTLSDAETKQLNDLLDRLRGA